MIDVYKILLQQYRTKLAELNMSLQLSELRDGSDMTSNMQEIIQDIVHTKLYIAELQQILDTFEAKQNTTQEGKEDAE
tara:strand:- start:305 stop:538 length:234 start_codon:yes stop_codon:yes gene_type:complete